MRNWNAIIGSVKLNTLIQPKSFKMDKADKSQRVIFLRINPELHAALKAQAKSEGATINKFLTKQIEQISAAATLRK